MSGRRKSTPRHCRSTIALTFILVFGVTSWCLFFQSIQLSEASRKFQFLFPTKHPQRKRLAICLNGGARDFELTSTSIKRHLLDVHNKADVFLHAPLDENAFKFSLLRNASNLKRIRIFRPQNFSVDQYEDLLASKFGQGRQGLLQYFNIVEGCWKLIRSHEVQHNFTYDWIIQVRVDSYFNSPFPPLSSFYKGSYMIPYGSEYGGLNDRGGIGDHSTSQVAFNRFSILTRIQQKLHAKNVNSEKQYKLQFMLAKVPVRTRGFPFCILSRKRFSWPLRSRSLPVVSISSRGSLNGAYCRPCIPAIAGSEAKAVHEKLERSYGWIGPAKDMDLELCNAGIDWEDGWEERFDEIAGKEAAETRKLISNMYFEECRKRMDEFIWQWNVWDGPSSAEICLAHYA